VVHAKIKLGWRALRRRRSAGNMTARNPNPYQRVCQGLAIGPFKFWWWWSVRFGSRTRLEKGRSGAHIPRMETIVKCDCGAEYKRTEAKFLMPHTGHVSCEVCGAVLESWLESTHVATFELVKRPDRKPV
jgi:hypothetical protein